jgi:hypothetical protein
MCGSVELSVLHKVVGLFKLFRIRNVLMGGNESRVKKDTVWVLIHVAYGTGRVISHNRVRCDIRDR